MSETIKIGTISMELDKAFQYAVALAWDMIKAGVIDPAKVTRLALQNAASIAGLMLTTEALVADVKEEEKKVAASAGGGMGGMY